MTNWRVEFFRGAFQDFQNLDGSVKVPVAKAIAQLGKDPFAYGEPLGNRTGNNLTGLYKKKVADRSIRIVYLAIEGVIRIVGIVVIDARAEGRVYRKARERLDRYEGVIGKLKEAALSGDRNLFDRISEKLRTKRFEQT